MGCIMEEFETNGVTVIRVHQLLPHVHEGIAVGDIVASINGQSVRQLNPVLSRSRKNVFAVAV